MSVNLIIGTFMLEIDDDSSNPFVKTFPVLFPILRIVEMNISGIFFHKAGNGGFTDTKNILMPFAAF